MRFHRGTAAWSIRIKKPILFLGDGDAVRQAFGFKGAAGVRCCWRCSNVKSGDLAVPHFLDTSCGDPNLFQEASDQEIFQACDAALGIPEGTRRALYEKTCGCSVIPTGVLQDPVCREWLPPSAALFDSMHLFYGNGLVSWELALFFKKFKEEVPGFDLSWLERAMVASEWLAPKESGRNSPNYLKELCFPKYWADDIFKGQVHQVQSVFPLLHYYVEEAALGVCEDATHSFRCLMDLHRELRKLWYTPVPIRDATALNDLNAKHHVAFVRAYGAQHNKPKHHWRHHLGQSAVQLQRLPNCEPHEKKHKLYKTARLADTYVCHVNNSEEFQRSMLFSLLSATIHYSNDLGFYTWKLLDKVYALEKSLEKALGDISILWSAGIQLYDTKLWKDDILIFGEETAGQVIRCLASRQRRWIEMRILRFRSKTPWGTRWAPTEATRIWRVANEMWFDLPSYWRFSEGIYECLH